MKLEDQIAESLFTNGAGEKAQRLVLELNDKRDGGGWCLDAVRDLIRDSLADQENLRQQMGGFLYSLHSTFMIQWSSLHQKIESVKNWLELIEELYAATGSDVNRLEFRKKGSKVESDNQQNAEHEV